MHLLRSTYACIAVTAKINLLRVTESVYVSVPVQILGHADLSVYLEVSNLE